MAVIGQQLLQPEAGWRRIDNTDKLIKYTNGCTHNDSITSGYWENSRVLVEGGNDYGFTFYTNSSRLRILGGHLYRDRTSTAEIYIDNIKLKSFSQQNNDKESIHGLMLSSDIHLPTGVKKITIINKDIVNKNYIVFDCLDIDEDTILLPELSKDYEFPVKIGNLADVETYSSSLIGGEEQLLITREGSLYLTDGNGSYKVISEDVDLSNYYNKTEIDDSLLLKANQDTTYSKEEVDNLIATVEPPAGATHTHNNTDTLINLGNSAGMLTYGGKVVVNNNEYSFRTLPRAKVITNYSTEKGGRLPWLV